MFEGLNEEKFKLKYRLGLRGRSVSWVVQVDPLYVRKLMGEERVYVGLRSCRVREYVDVLRCFKCQGLGHVGKWCGRAVTCRRCGEEGHHVSRCGKVMEGLECANRKRMGFKEVNHSVMFNKMLVC